MDHHQHYYQHTSLNLNNTFHPYHDTTTEESDDGHHHYHRYYHNITTTDPTASQQQHYLYHNSHNQVTANNINNNNNKEPMFEKPLTPSDVGKLNRLVIPKQHAEKYFPLNGSNSTTTYNSNNNNESHPSAGTLLSFEDESGKSWQFRYSYWNSSQSYVLTKGWSRYVKDKRLDAGDVVVFERDVVCPERLFIGWRRRASGRGGSSGNSRVQSGHPVRGGQDGSICSSSVVVGEPIGFGIGAPAYHHRADHGFHEAATVGGSNSNSSSNNNNHSRGSGGGGSSSKRHFRLFGVNLECQQQPADDHSPTTTSSESSSMSSQQQQYYQQQQHQGPPSSSSVYGGNYFDNHNQYHDHHHHHQIV